MLLDDLGSNALRQALANPKPFPFESPYFAKPVDSAVLIIIHLIENQWHVLLTKRSENLTSHPGQVSFPGGRVETSDKNLQATAIRETEEEVGISTEQVEVIGELTPVTTLTGYKIHPYVAFVKKIPELNLQVEEVADAFHVPLDWLVDLDNMSTVERVINQQTIKTFRLEWNEYTIWGATAMMIAELGHRLRNSEPFHKTR